MIEGSKDRAFSNNSSLRAAPTPTNSSTNCEPETLRKVCQLLQQLLLLTTFSLVLLRKTPLGTLAPSLENYQDQLKLNNFLFKLCFFISGNIFEFNFRIRNNLNYILIKSCKITKWVTCVYNRVI
jgi:hypothetical protein